MKVGLILCKCFIIYPNSVSVLISFVFSSCIINEFEIIVSTMLFSIDEAITIVHGCWNKTILIDQACSLSHVIIVAQPCYQVVTVLMVEHCYKSWLDNLVDNIVHGVHHNPVHRLKHNMHVCTFTTCVTCAFTRVGLERE